MLVDEYTFKIIIQGSFIDEERLFDMFEDSGYDFDYIPCGMVMSKSLNLSTPCETFFIYKTYDNFDHGIKDFVTLVLRYSSNIKSLRMNHCVKFICFINADSAQIDYYIPNDAMRIFADLKVDLNFSILSWGLVEENE